MSKTIDFIFDFACPYAYLASTRVEALAERSGATLVPRPASPFAGRAASPC